MGMEIKTAEFVKGVTGDDYSMGDELPHVAFLGRSNVGKSSVINSLLGRKDLVRKSSKPGKTREANFFRINDVFYAIDFPGYGYAKMSLKERDRLIKRILWYIQYSEYIPVLTCLIVDAQVGLTDHDKEMLAILREKNHKVLIVANKADKMNQKKMHAQMKAIEESAQTYEILPYSAQTSKGKERVWSVIDAALEQN